MQAAQTSRQPETDTWVVSPAPADGERLRVKLAATGLLSQVTSDLDEALAAAPAVLLIEPSGWEGACRMNLEMYASRSHPPPAVLLCSDDPHVQLRAGPAYQYLDSSCAKRQLAAAVAGAQRARRAFAAYWPSILGVFPAADEARVKRVLQQRTGFEIRSDRQGAFEQAVRTRMVARLTPRLRDYAEYLERSRGEYSEAELLGHLLVIGETYFWRYSGQFQVLQQELLPQLARGAPGAKDRCLRIWSAGCSSGEEPYSLVIACREALPPGWSVQVLGTDLSRTALARAAEGVYGDRTLRNLPRELRERYFEAIPGGARVKAPVREQVCFEQLNLRGEGTLRWARDHGPFHAVFCRNTLIYFARPDVDRLVELFESSLVEGGGLFLGASETLYPQRRGLETVRGAGSFFFRKPPRPGPVDGPLPSPAENPDDARADELYQQGMGCLDTEEFEGAGEAFRQVLQLRPGDARGHTGLALLLANQGREVEAGEHLERAAAGGPALAETSFLSGLLEERSGNDGRALQHYDEALALDQRFFMAHVNRAWILRRLGRRARFVEEMRDALSILKDKPRVAPWLTGGLGWEALLEMVHDALRREEREA